MATQDEECRSDEMCVMNNKIRKEMTKVRTVWDGSRTDVITKR